MDKHLDRLVRLTAQGTKYVDEAPDDVLGGPGLRNPKGMRQNAIVNGKVNDVTTCNLRS
jgi:hypothetical protein